MQVCRAAGYYDHALYVAHAAHEPEWYLDILVDDCGKFDDALAYLQNLARQEAAAALKKHGKVRGMAGHGPAALLARLEGTGNGSSAGDEWHGRVAVEARPGEWSEFQVRCRQLTSSHDTRQEAAAALRKHGRV